MVLLPLLRFMREPAERYQTVILSNDSPANRAGAICIFVSSGKQNKPAPLDSLPLPTPPCTSHELQAVSSQTRPSSLLSPQHPSPLQSSPLSPQPSSLPSPQCPSLHPSCCSTPEVELWLVDGANHHSSMISGRSTAGSPDNHLARSNGHTGPRTEGLLFTGSI